MGASTASRSSSQRSRGNDGDQSLNVVEASIAELRVAGAICLGLTNMPPMANGGMRRGLYGRAESPYNGDYFTAAFASGSSNGSGTPTASSFAAFGLGEKTWSSGRAPASNNALCAYTPSRGVISVRGNWPLAPTMDVVVPYTRSMADLFEVLDVIAADDPNSRGDFWRVQPWVAIPRAFELRPAPYRELGESSQRGGVLAGKRFGVPAMYVNGNAAASGAEVVIVDFPAVSNDEADRIGAPSILNRGLVSPEFLERELWDLSIWAWDDFLRANGAPLLNRLSQVDGERIFPRPLGALPDRYGALDFDLANYVTGAHERGAPKRLLELEGLGDIEAELRGLEETRRIGLEAWMDELKLDAIMFPAVAVVSPTTTRPCWATPPSSRRLGGRRTVPPRTPALAN